MSLLFDENLSPRLPFLVADAFPDSHHLREFNYQGMPDAEVWRLGRDQNLCIVSCDSDFYWLAFSQGHPPKVVWVQADVSATAAIAGCLRANRTIVERFLQDPQQSVLVLVA